MKVILGLHIQSQRKFPNAQHYPGDLKALTHSEVKHELESLNEYKKSFAKKCEAFLEQVNNLYFDNESIYSAISNGEINYRLLLGDFNWTVPRAILEAQAFLKEVKNDPNVY